jgi:hypothetical protein
MDPYKNARNLTILVTLFNCKLKKGHCFVENLFGILKQTFCELFVKLDLDVVFFSDVITCYAILHNILLGQSHTEVEKIDGCYT